MIIHKVANLEIPIPENDYELRTVYGRPNSEDCFKGKVQLPIHVRGSKQTEIRCHIKAEKAFKFMFEQLARADLTRILEQISFIYENRSLRGSFPPVPSLHEWGIAIDFNTNYNVPNRTILASPAPMSDKDKPGKHFYSSQFHVHPLIEIMTQCGFRWGGHRTDGNTHGDHFQLASLAL